MIKTILKNIVCFIISGICMSIVLSNVVPGGYWPSAISLFILSVNYMIWVTGDTHGDWIHRVNMDSFPEQREMSKDDYVIILGDFGIWRDSPQQRWYLNWLEEKHFTTLFIDGNHENYDILDSYPVEEWHGGKVHFIKPSIIHLMRGQVFDIDGLKFFTFGGAASHDISDGVLEIDDPRVKEWRDNPDKMYRINHISWWEREMPDEKEMDEGIKNLAEHNNKVDFILTHCTASSTAALLSHGLYKPDKLTNYLEEIRCNVDYKRWLCGHYHDNKAITVKDIVLYEQIVRIA